MTYAECVAANPNAPAVYCLQISGDMGQAGVAPPPVNASGWQFPTALQLQAYTNAQGYLFCLKTILGKIELFALNPSRRELINYSSMNEVKKMFPSFATPGQIAAIDYIILPPNVPFGMIALAVLNKNKIVRIVPGTSESFEVMGYPPALSYLAPPPPVTYDPTIPDDPEPDPAPPPTPDADPILPDGGAPVKNNLLMYAGIGLLFLILK